MCLCNYTYDIYVFIIKFKLDMYSSNLRVHMNKLDEELVKAQRPLLDTLE